MVPFGRTVGGIAVASLIVTATTSAQSPADDARPALTAALADAKKSRKHILLNFGAEWCRECRVLDQTFADPNVAVFLKENFIVVPVHVGKMVRLNYAELNIELVRKYQVFTNQHNTGIPYIVILDADGQVIARTDNGEWRKAAAVQPENVIQDLRRWAPKARAANSK